MICSVNILAVAIATVASFVIGMIWYTPLTFGKSWMREVGLEGKEISKQAQMKGFSLSFLTAIIQSVGIAYAMCLLGWQGPLAGIKLGIFASLFFVATTIGMNYAYEQRSFKLFLINAGYNLVYFVIIGAIIGAMQ